MPEAAYRTSDLVLASVLSLEGMEVSLELDDSSGRVMFVVRSDEDQDYVSELAHDVISCKQKVEPLAFAKSLAHVRNMMYRFQEERGQREPRRRGV